MNLSTIIKLHDIKSTIQTYKWIDLEVAKDFYSPLLLKVKGNRSFSLFMRIVLSLRSKHAKQGRLKDFSL